MNTLRFVLIIPAMIAIWIASFCLGLYSLDVSAALFCPANSGSGSDCYAAFWPDVETGFRIFWSAISALTVVLVAYVLAPKHKLAIVVAAYVLGALFATALALGSSSWWEWLAAIVAGAIPIVMTLRRLPPPRVWQRIE